MTRSRVVTLFVTPLFLTAGLMFDIATAAPAYKIDAVSSTSTPIRIGSSALQNDGRLLVEIERDIDMSRCPVGTTDSQVVLGCGRSSTRTMGLAGTVGSTTTPIPYDFTKRAIRSNNNGLVVSWPLDADGYESAAPTQDATQYTAVTNTSQGAFASSGVTLPLPTNTSGTTARYDWWLLSNSGHLVGQLSNGPTDMSLAIWSGKAAPNLLPAPAGYRLSRAVGVNASQQVAVNTYRVVNGTFNSRAALAKGTQIKNLPLPLFTSYSDSKAVAINDKGDVVGTMYSDAGGRALLWRYGLTINLGTLPGYSDSVALGLTSTGKVLACAYNQNVFNPAPQPAQLFIWDQGVRTPWSKAVTVPADVYVPDSCSSAYIGYQRAAEYQQAVLSNQQGQLLLYGYFPLLLSPLK